MLTSSHGYVFCLVTFMSEGWIEAGFTRLTDRNEESATETYINTYSVEQDGPRTFVYIFLVCINVFFSGPNECRNWYVWPTGKIFKSDGIPHNKIRKTLNNISYKCGHKALSFKIDTFSNFYAIYNTLFNIVI